jgi:hypothetical protein
LGRGSCDRLGSDMARKVIDRPSLRIQDVVHESDSGTKKEW